MTTLLTVGNSEGQKRCDAKCYDAVGGHCDCCCGGRNHGRGRNEAMRNTRELFGFSRDDLVFADEVKQLDLPRSARRG